MTVLPIVDLLILMGTGSLAIGFVLKGVALTTTYNPTFLGFSSIYMLLIALTCFAVALVVTSRTWLRLNEPHLQALDVPAPIRRPARTLRAEESSPRSPAPSPGATNQPLVAGLRRAPRLGRPPPPRPASTPSAGVRAGHAQPQQAAPLAQRLSCRALRP